MKRNSRLALALHTLSHMAGAPERVRTSQDIAEHSGTNPVVVRRVLGLLREAGLLTSEKGHAGGWKLAKAPDKITMADVYLALGESVVAASALSETPSCAIEKALFIRVTRVMAEVEDTLIARLSETTLADVRCAAADA